MEIWSAVSKDITPDETEENLKRAAIAELAEVSRLTYTELSIPEQYATRFGMDPDLVWQKEFDDVMVWIKKWHAKSEFDDRYRAIEKSLTEASK